MNYLAHLFLAPAAPDAVIGNLCADFLDAENARDMHAFSPGIRDGIRLHREVDRVTDAHPVVRESKRLVWEPLGHYAPLAVDVYYDHFLTKHWARYAPEPLDGFVESRLDILAANLQRCPPLFREIFPRMREQRWLYSYADLNGLTTTFERISARASRPATLRRATEALMRCYDEIERDFEAFFPQLREHVADYQLRNDAEN